MGGQMDSQVSLQVHASRKNLYYTSCIIQLTCNQLVLWAPACVDLHWWPNDEKLVSTCIDLYRIWVRSKSMQVGGQPTHFTQIRIFSHILFSTWLLRPSWQYVVTTTYCSISRRNYIDNSQIVYFSKWKQTKKHRNKDNITANMRTENSISV